MMDFLKLCWKCLALHNAYCRHCKISAVNPVEKPEQYSILNKAYGIHLILNRGFLLK